VFERILERMRHLVRDRQYVLTTHGQDAMEDDELIMFDVERCLLAGRIVERQRDRQRHEWKYLVQGPGITGAAMVVVAKIGRPGRLVIVTVYVVEGEAP
jgi:threonine dehydrogenase-like Zn-dependent dehydrogenase